MIKKFFKNLFKYLRGFNRHSIFILYIITTLLSGLLMTNRPDFYKNIRPEYLEKVAETPSKLDDMANAIFNPKLHGIILIVMSVILLVTLIMHKNVLLLVALMASSYIWSLFLISSLYHAVIEGYRTESFMLNFTMLWLSYILAYSHDFKK